MSLGKCFFEFLSSFKDVHCVRSVNFWNLNVGVLKLFPWTRDFVPSTLKQTSAQVWIRIHGLDEEYWRHRIIFAIANNVWTVICIDSTYTKPSFDQPFGHFVRALVYLDLTEELSLKILVKIVGFAFLWTLNMRRLWNYAHNAYRLVILWAIAKKRNNNRKRERNPYHKIT